MGFFRGPDRIGSLSHSAGVITLSLPALSLVNRYTIRGQQYDFSAISRTISADVTMAAGTRYFVYALVSGGTVVLRISASAPSVYKLANPTSEIIGAFYSNNSSAWGAFVDVFGKPRFLGNSVIDYTPVFTNMTVTVDFFNWNLDGEFAIFLGRYVKSAGVAAVCSISLPTNLSVSSRLPSASPVCLGQHAFQAVSASDGGLTVQTTTPTVMYPTFSGAAFSGKLQVVNGNIPGNNPYSVDARIPIEGFTNTPFKDL